MAGSILVGKKGFFELSFGRNYKQKCGRYQKQIKGWVIGCKIN